MPKYALQQARAEGIAMGQSLALDLTLHSGSKLKA